MTTLILGLALFLGVHLVPTFPSFREGLQSRLGKGGYTGLFALASFAGLVLIVMGFRVLQDHPEFDPQIWYPPPYMRHITFLLMLPSMILLAASQIPSRIRTAVRHPMLLAVKIWALAHLLVNGNLSAMLLAGSFLLWAAYDRVSVKRRQALGPLGTKSGGLINDIAVVVVGILAYAFMLVWGHQHLIGRILVPAFA